MKKELSGLLSFGRVVGAALVIVGFVFLALVLGNKAKAAGYPPPVVIAIYLAGVFFGLWQGWLSLKNFWDRDG